ncbi:nitrilase-related carbon-nitrogen hydrolase [Ammoniphilus sp. 3BR4]|uniref:nitrilase-related carbon-nitrogen hydrolase n=1 Tax=Ammoniphilus sp. 3BR4 TaxID=3158265 RepID=UPI00346519B9
MRLVQYPFKAASIQFNPKLHEREENIRDLLKIVTEAAQKGAKLIVTPEMATTGYHYADRQAIEPFVDTIPGVTTGQFEFIAKQYDAYIVIGMPEVDKETGIYYNSAAFVGPEGYIGKYRKTHLWETEERWAAWGDLGIPVFYSKLGKIAINICMDSAYFESARIPALLGADILVFLTNSTAQSISMLQDRAESNGLYIISANRSNTEKGYHMIGASCIWSPYGEKLAETDFIPTSNEDIDEPVILYADMNPRDYDNPGKRRLQERRPELYQELMLSAGPWDSRKTTNSKSIQVAVIQYHPNVGDKSYNLRKIGDLLMKTVKKAEDFGEKLDLLVLPELSFIGPVHLLSNPMAYDLAEPMDGLTVKMVKAWAQKYQVHMIFGLIEKENEFLYNTALLISPEGDCIGKYRKTHLTVTEKEWASPGQQISVFPTQIGKIGIMIGYDAAFPEVYGVMAVQRADMIAIPASWEGSYGKEIQLIREIPIYPYPLGSLTTWNAVAMGAQAYTIIANYVGCGCLGGSGLYTLDPLYGLDKTRITSMDQEEGQVFRFTTVPSEWWFNQEKLILSRRTHFYKPLINDHLMILDRDVI